MCVNYTTGEYVGFRTEIEDSKKRNQYIYPFLGGGGLQSIQQTTVDGLVTETKQISVFIMNVCNAGCDS